MCLGAQQLDESADDVLAESYALALEGYVGTLRVGRRRRGTCRSETESLPVGTSALFGIADQSGDRPTADAARADAGNEGGSDG
jgi:hypothetical protein